MSSETPDPSAITLPEVIRVQIRERLADVRTCMPGRVVAYKKETQEAAVQPLLKGSRRGQDGERIVDVLPVIEHVPVVFPGTGAYSLTWPIKVGDTVLLVFSESSLDKWLVSGDIVDPADPRRFTITDGIAIPGLRSFNDALDDVPDDAIVLTSPDPIRIGDVDAADPVARKSDLDAIVDMINGHVHPETGTTTSAVAVPYSTPDCSDKVFVE